MIIAAIETVEKVENSQQIALENLGLKAPSEPFVLTPAPKGVFAANQLVQCGCLWMIF